MTATCSDCDQLALARADVDTEIVAWLFAGVSFIAAAWRVGKARRRLALLEETQPAALAAVVDVDEHQGDVDVPAAAAPAEASP